MIHKLRFSSVTFLATSLAVSSAFSADADFFSSQRRFYFASQASDYSLIQWAPTTPRQELGINASVHGSSYEACDFKTNCVGGSCFVRNSFLASPERVLQTSGLENGVSYSPICPDAKNQMSNSYVAISRSGPNRGIGIYTHTGRQPYSNLLSFLQPKQHNIFGNYISLPAYMKAESMRPFSSECSGANCDSRIQLRLLSQQTVKSAINNGVSQTQQKMDFVLENTAVRGTAETPARIEFTPFTFCAGVNCTPTARANVNLGDPYQGGMPFIGGFILGSGHPTYVESQYGRTKAWTSYGPARTSSLPFSNLRFEYRISWEDFKKLLIHITQMRLKTQSVDEPMVAVVFGTGWDNRNNWRLKYIRFGQEVYNPIWETGDIASIGGNMPWIQMDAITFP